MNSFKFKVGIFTLIFAGSCIFFGCGSENKAESSASRKDQKRLPHQKVQIVELLTNGSSKSASSPRSGPQITEVTPPSKTGPGPIDLEKAEAAIKASKQVDPRSVEIIPPRKPGEQGTTLGQVEASIPAKVMTDPQSIEVIPPRKPGERGITQGRAEALKPAQGIDPQFVEVIPPSKPGGQGLTMQKVNTNRGSQGESSDNARQLLPIPSMPPKSR